MRNILIILILVNLSVAKDYGLIVVLGKYLHTDKRFGYRYLKDSEKNLKIIVKISNRLGIKKSDLIILRDKKATKNNILKKLQLISNNFQKGDRFFMYFSGHGISSEDNISKKSLFNIQGKFSRKDIDLMENSGALATYDSKNDYKNIINSHIIGKRDLKPIFIKIDELASSSLVILDSCYSKCATREDSNRLCGLSTNILTDKKNYPYKKLISVTSSAGETDVGFFTPLLDKCLKTSNSILSNIDKCLKDNMKKKNNLSKIPILFPIDKSVMVFK